jgi:hypothetical protein
MAKTSKKKWTKHFAKFLADYIEHENDACENGLSVREIELVRDFAPDIAVFMQAIYSYESQNDCTIVFVKDKI